MATQFGEVLAKALSDKKNDINSYIWKGPRKYVNGKRIQEETKLVDATPEQLQKFYDYCKSMLTNTSSQNPGRLILLEKVKEERIKCNVELFMRYIENAYQSSERRKIPRFLFLQELREAMDATPDFPIDKVDSITISTFKSYNIPEEFAHLTIKDVTNGCLNQLGIFNKKQITLPFIINLGICLTKKEKKEFNNEYKMTGRDVNEIIHERCGLKDSLHLKIIPNGSLSYSEFRSMIMLRNIEYSLMTTDQLKVLREKVLFHLEDEIRLHIKQWKTRMSQIETVAKARNITIC